MSRYLIEQVRRKKVDGGIACGLVAGYSCTSIKYRKDNNQSLWLELDEADGIPQFYLSDEDHLDIHANLDASDEEIDALNKECIDEFDGISLSEDYNDYYNQFTESQKNNPATNLLRYIICVTKCSDDKLTRLIDLATGKYADEITVPLSEEE